MLTNHLKMEMSTTSSQNVIYIKYTTTECKTYRQHNPVQICMTVTNGPQFILQGITHWLNLTT
jgi:hypothetical protein